MDQISATTAIKKACNYVGGQSEMAKPWVFHRLQ